MLTWCRLVVSVRTYKCSARFCSSVTLVKAPTNLTETKAREKRVDSISDSDFEEKNFASVLAPGLGTEYDFSDYGRQLGRTQTFSAYANKSPTLQKLIDLGVDLSQIEKKKEVPNFILGLDFDRDIAGHIRLLADVGVEADSLGKLFTKNPYLLKERKEDLQTRINYLMHLKFEFKDFQRLICGNPLWLSHSVDDLQKRVAYFQKAFYLSLADLRALALDCPKLITHKIQLIEANSFSITVEMGFKKSELKTLLNSRPKIWLVDNKELLERFHFLHNKLKIPHGLIAKQPHALLTRVNRLRVRHFFLDSLGKAQYDPRLPNYVSLVALVTGNDAEFASSVADTSLDDFRSFLKTI